MPQTLPRLRHSLDFSASPAPDQPGLLVRDPLHYSDAMLIIPPALVGCLSLFDGTSTDLDLRAALVRLTGDLRVGEVERHLWETLSASGFLEDEKFRQMRDERQQQFAEAPVRRPLLAGGGYPSDAAALRKVMCGYMNGSAEEARLRNGLCGIAAPHVSLDGGWRC